MYILLNFYVLFSKLYRIFKPEVILQIFLFVMLLSFATHNTITMGFLDKLRRKKDETVEKVKEQTAPQPYHPENAQAPPGKKIKKYSSDGKPVYE